MEIETKTDMETEMEMETDTEIEMETEMDTEMVTETEIETEMGVYFRICACRHLVQHTWLDGLIGFIRTMNQQENKHIIKTKQII